MKPIKFPKPLLQDIKIDEHFKKFLEEASAERLTEVEENNLLDEIRKGNRDAIGKLLDSSEFMILKVIEKDFYGQKPLDEMIKIGKTALYKLAEKELNSNEKPIFFRFGAWCVRQSLLANVIKK